MDGSYEVVTAALENHARTIDGLARELRSALAEVAGVSLTGDAYGRIGQQAATAIQDLAKQNQETLQDGVDALDSAASTLRDTASGYERQETAAIAALTSAATPNRPDTPDIGSAMV
jgi:hypothetical protein